MKTNRFKAQESGSVLLEALIAILIFSIGILALVGMQATAINTVADSNYRSTAGFLADQIVGTIWANRSNAFNANTSNVMVASPDTAFLTFACNPCDATNGNAYTRAWVTNGVSAQLPNGTANIVINGTLVTVTVRWQPPDAQVAHRHIVSTTID